mmetsp:Transcript_71687/g.210532  ORF Transcript_71687/g.210532 Transcript_71687/m.210532 type:complete len:300 (-) Transcript_71687:290-1189(-)
MLELLHEEAERAEALLEVAPGVLQVRLGDPQPPEDGLELGALAEELLLLVHQLGVVAGAGLVLVEEEGAELGLAGLLLLREVLDARGQDLDEVARVGGLRRGGRRGQGVGGVGALRLLLVASGVADLGAELDEGLVLVVIVVVIVVVVVVVADGSLLGDASLVGPEADRRLRGGRLGVVQDAELLRAAVVRLHQGRGDERPSDAQLRLQLAHLVPHELVAGADLLRVLPQGVVAALEAGDILGDLAVLGDHGAVRLLLALELLLEDLLLARHLRLVLALGLQHALLEGVGLGVDGPERL